MGLFGDLLGGGSEKQTTDIDQLTTREPFALANPSIGGVLDLSETILGDTLDFFPGDGVADLTGDQLTGIDMLRNQFADDGSLTTGVINPAIDAFQGFLDPDFSEFNPLLTDLVGSVTNDITTSLGEDILPLLGVESIGATGGGVFDSRSELLNLGAAERALRAIGSASADIRGGFTEGLLDRQFGAVQGLGNFLDNASSPGETLLGIGSILQDQEQNEINFLRERHDFEQNEPFVRASRGNALTLPIATNFGSTHTTGTTETEVDGGGSFFGDLLGGGLVLAGLPSSSVGGKLLGKLPGFG